MAPTEWAAPEAPPASDPWELCLRGRPGTEKARPGWESLDRLVREKHEKEAATAEKLLAGVRGREDLQFSAPGTCLRSRQSTGPPTIPLCPDGGAAGDARLGTVPGKTRTCWPFSSERHLGNLNKISSKCNSFSMFQSFSGPFLYTRVGSRAGPSSCEPLHPLTIPDRKEAERAPREETP